MYHCGRSVVLFGCTGVTLQVVEGMRVRGQCHPFDPGHWTTGLMTHGTL